MPDTREPIKKAGAKYFDKPRFSLITKYEGEMLNNYETMLQSMVKNIGRTLKKFVE
jgi:hypothetical protein